ncbi:CotH kinase family protein, partial [Candidatus Sumerlaeota bacterium]|nr:CotH kinase family protein [Candidatus Sumerlaeota bacterium]
TAGTGVAGYLTLGLPRIASAQMPATSDEADENLFDDTQLLEIELVFSDPDWESIIDDVTYLEATLIHAGVSYPGVGVRLKGNSSLSIPNSSKRPLKVDMNRFNDEQSLFGVTKFVLNNGFMDPTMMREHIAYTMVSAMGVPCSRSNLCRLTIGGVYWGIHTFVEAVNKPMTTRFWEDLDGNRFKCDPHGDLTWQGPDQAAYEDDYELDTNEEENDWSDLIHLIDGLNNTPLGSLQAALEPLFDVDGLMRFLAVNTLLANLDSYQGSGHNCYVLDVDPSIGRFVHIPWDMNEAFGCFNMGMSPSQLRVMPLPWVGGNRPLITRILGVADWGDLFIHRIQRTLDTVFRDDWLDAEITRLHALIDSSVQEDPNRLYTYQQCLTNQTSDVLLGNRWAPGLRSFTADRHTFARQQVGAAPIPTPAEIADHLTGRTELEGIPRLAADRDDDGAITIGDLVRTANGE